MNKDRPTSASQVSQSKPRELDGVDLNSIIRDGSSTTSLDALKNRGHQTVRVLNERRIRDMIHDIVMKKIDELTLELKEDEQKRLEERVQTELKEILKSNTRLTAHTRALREKAGMYEEELKKLSEKLRLEETVEVSEDRVTLSPQAFIELEARLGEIIHATIEERWKSSLAEGNPEELKSVLLFEMELRQAAKSLLKEAREKAFAENTRHHENQIELLEKRISKMTRALTETTEELHKSRSSNAQDQGIASIYSEIQGLDKNDRLYRKKKEVLEIIFKENVQLQESIGVA